MPRRTVLTERQRAVLFDLPQDEATLTRFYTLSEEEIAVVRRRRRPRNRLGFALQPCAFRYPGRLLQPGELIPERMLAFVAAQLGLSGIAAKALTTPGLWPAAEATQAASGGDARANARGLSRPVRSQA